MTDLSLKNGRKVFWQFDPHVRHQRLDIRYGLLHDAEGNRIPLSDAECEEAAQKINQLLHPELEKQSNAT